MRNGEHAPAVDSKSAVREEPTRRGCHAEFDAWGSKCDTRRVRDRARHVPHQFAVLEDGECGGDDAADVSGLGTRAAGKERKYGENGKRYSATEYLAHRTSLRRAQGRYVNERKGTAWNVHKPNGLLPC